MQEVASLLVMCPTSPVPKEPPTISLVLDEALGIIIQKDVVGVVALLGGPWALPSRVRVAYPSLTVGDLDPNLALGSSGVHIFLLTSALMDSPRPGPPAGDEDLSLLFPTWDVLVGGFLYAPFPSAGIAEYPDATASSNAAVAAFEQFFSAFPVSDSISQPLRVLSTACMDLHASKS